MGGLIKLFKMKAILVLLVAICLVSTVVQTRSISADDDTTNDLTTLETTLETTKASTTMTSTTTTSTITPNIDTTSDNTNSTTETTTTESDEDSYVSKSTFDSVTVILFLLVAALICSNIYLFCKTRSRTGYGSFGR